MKGQAFITLPSEDAAKKALRDTNGFVLNSKPMVVVSFHSVINYCSMSISFTQHLYLLVYTQSHVILYQHLYLYPQSHVILYQHLCLLVYTQSHHHHHQSLNPRCHWGNTVDLTTNSLHLSLFSTALLESPNPMPVHSLMLSSHLFFCLPLLLHPRTVPCKIVFASPDDLET